MRKKQKSRGQRVNVLDTGKELARDVKADRRVKYKGRDKRSWFGDSAWMHYE